MKTIEEKAKAYDESLEKARKWYNANTNAGYRTIFEEIFPELAESKNEKIRKKLIKETKGCEVRLFEAVTNDEFVAWLEEQGEQNPAWSEEDKSRIITICTYLQDYARLSGSESRTIRINEYCDWLKSLRPQSEHDIQAVEKWFNEHFSFIKDSKDNQSSCEILSFEFNSKKDMFESFAKEVGTSSSNHWKPSDEQITWLYRAADDASKDSRMKQILNELLSDLKKLKGE